MSDDKVKLERALKLLAIGVWAQMAYVILRMVLFRVWMPSFEVLEKVQAITALSLDLYLLWAWVSLAQATDPEKHKLVRATALLTGVLAVVGLQAFFPQHGPEKHSPILGAVTMLLWMAEGPLAWYSLLGLWDPARARPASATTFMWAMVVLRALISSVYFLPTHLFDSVGFRPWMLYSWLAYLSVPLSLIAAGLSLWLIAQLRRAPSTATDALGADPTLTPPMPGNDFVVGTLWLVGGLLVTFVSYAAASSGSGGGRYFVTTGAIAYGLGRIIRGFTRR